VGWLLQRRGRDAPGTAASLHLAVSCSLSWSYPSSSGPEFLLTGAVSFLCRMTAVSRAGTLCVPLPRSFSIRITRSAHWCNPWQYGSTCGRPAIRARSKCRQCKDDCNKQKTEKTTDNPLHQTSQQRFLFLWNSDFATTNGTVT
jgi:hypothetical protein